MYEYVHKLIYMFVSAYRSLKKMKMNWNFISLCLPFAGSRMNMKSGLSKFYAMELTLTGIYKFVELFSVRLPKNVSDYQRTSATNRRCFFYLTLGLMLAEFTRKNAQSPPKTSSSHFPFIKTCQTKKQANKRRFLLS
jgi:hypothetical protein